MLVVGGGGAVGFAGVQLAVAAGCHVSTTCGSESIDRLLAAGAEQAIDYTTQVTNTLKCGSVLFYGQLLEIMIFDYACLFILLTSWLGAELQFCVIEPFSFLFFSLIYRTLN